MCHMGKTKENTHSLKLKLGSFPIDSFLPMKFRLSALPLLFAYYFVKPTMLVRNC